MHIARLLEALKPSQYDIAGMSTDRGWTSCQNLADGSECLYVPEDIKHGTRKSLSKKILVDIDTSLHGMPDTN